MAGLVRSVGSLTARQAGRCHSLSKSDLNAFPVIDPVRSSCCMPAGPDQMSIRCCRRAVMKRGCSASYRAAQDDEASATTEGCVAGGWLGALGRRPLKAAIVRLGDEYRTRCPGCAGELGRAADGAKSGTVFDSA